MTISFTIEGKPRGKGRPRVGKFGGRPYTPPATRAAEKEVATLARIARGSAPLMTGTVELAIVAVFEPPKSWKPAVRSRALAGELDFTGKPDRDNIEKLIADALNGVLWLDDSQVHGPPCVRRYGQPARTEVTVTERVVADRDKSPAEVRREAKLMSGGHLRARRKPIAKKASPASVEPAIGKRIK